MMSIIIPYRDREAHLAVLAPRLRVVLPDAEILVIEQGDDKPFNRAKLLNIGAHYAQHEYLIMHDVDHYPNDGVDYTPKSGITQLASSEIQTHDFLGGVTIFYSYIFKLLGGYNNDYFHRAEDNEMMFHLKRKGLYVFNNFQSFQLLPHERKGPEFDPVLWEKAQRPRGMQRLQWETTCRERHDFYTKITVNL